MAQLKLLKANQLLRSLVHHVPDAVTGEHEEGVIARQALRQHVRLSRDDLILGLQLQIERAIRSNG